MNNPLINLSKVFRYYKNKIRLFIKIFILKKFEPIDIWFWKDGDNTFRIDYYLSPDSLVFDLGGYKGEWTSKIFKKYRCNIWVFEPVKQYYYELKLRFQDNDKIKLFNFGLSNHSGRVKIYLYGDGSSIYKIKNPKIVEEIELVDINEFIEQKNISKIDLMKINIEGCEYELLEALINKKNHRIIHNIQVQFHPWIENALIKREKIRNELRETHYETYCYPFVWENWELKK